jgi:hypothetical protein
VLPAVELEDEPRLDAQEVGDERSDRDLPPPLLATQAPIAQRCPEPRFRVRVVAPQSTCPRPQEPVAMIADHTHEGTIREHVKLDNTSPERRLGRGQGEGRLV